MESGIYWLEGLLLIFMVISGTREMYICLSMNTPQNRKRFRAAYAAYGMGDFEIFETTLLFLVGSTSH
jgi:hypothetical protein